MGDANSAGGAFALKHRRRPSRRGGVGSRRSSVGHPSRWSSWQVRRRRSAISRSPRLRALLTGRPLPSPRGPGWSAGFSFGAIIGLRALRVWRPARNAERHRQEALSSISTVTERRASPDQTCPARSAFPNWRGALLSPSLTEQPINLPCWFTKRVAPTSRHDAFSSTRTHGAPRNE